jgi:carbamoyl-phosphate synthase small subunit
MESLDLLLSDGTRWPGWGRRGSDDGGEVVFTTLSNGFSQALTDPSFAGQIVVFSFPMVGCYGADLEVLESARIWPRGIVTSLPCHGTSGGTDLFRWIEGSGLFWMGGVDTRRLVCHLRSRGTLAGRLLPAGTEGSVAAEGGSPVPLVSTPVPRELGGGGLRVVVIDYGVKEGILRELASRDCRVTVVPHDWEWSEILGLRPDGILLSNGPGDPALLSHEIGQIRGLLGKVPLFGICLGMQLLALALGAETEKLPFGHRGGNQPVIDVATGRGFVTSQNHGYALREDSLEGTGITVTHRHGGDGTIEGFRHDGGDWGVQFHPEATPGPRDCPHLFDRFIAQCREAKS